MWNGGLERGGLWCAKRIESPRESRLRAMSNASSSGQGDEEETGEKKSLLPAGRKQVRVEIPAVVLSIFSSDAAGDAGVKGIQELVVRGGVTAVVVEESISGGAAELYSVLLKLKESLEGRAMLLVKDRADIADAVGIDGVLLSPMGLPIVVAKCAMKNGAAVAGKIVSTAEEARQAAFEGAGFLVLRGSGSDKEGAASSSIGIEVEDVDAARKQSSGSSVPIIGSGFNSGLLFTDEYAKVVPGSKEVLALLDGVMVSLNGTDLENVDGTKQLSLISDIKMLLASSVVRSNKEEEEEVQNMAKIAASGPKDAEGEVVAKVAQVSDVLSSSREQMIESERTLLSSVIDFMEMNCPNLEEVSILKEAVQQLDELFLVVIVGEFNSGKSAVVNALLGDSVVPEGILPTTNEITVMKWCDVQGGEEERVEQVRWLHMYMHVCLFPGRKLLGLSMFLLVRVI